MELRQQLRALLRAEEPLVALVAQDREERLLALVERPGRDEHGAAEADQGEPRIKCWWGAPWGVVSLTESAAAKIRDLMAEEPEGEAAVRDLRPDFGLLKKVGGRGVIVTGRSAMPDWDFVSRFFAPAVGIDEDRAVAAPEGRLAKLIDAK